MNRARVVAVSGATGFLGFHLTSALARSGMQVRILARRPIAPDAWDGLPVDVVPGSLEDDAALDKLTAGADTIVHLAGLTKASGPADFLKTNRDGARALAQAARRQAPDARFIAASSLAARAPHLSAYAASKHAGEAAVRAVYQDAPDRCVILRLPAIYGPADRATLSIFQAAAMPLVPVFGAGRAALIHAADAADAIAKLAQGAGTAGTFALADTNPAGYRMEEILAEAARAQGKRARLVRLPGAMLRAAGWAASAWAGVSGQPRIFTAGKAREMLHPDWSVRPQEMLPPDVHQSRTGIAQGFAETVAWYRAAGWLA